MRTLRRTLNTLWFPFWFTWQLVKANAVLAWEVVTPSHYMRPGVIAVPLRSTSEIEITLVANLVSLTPGTISLEVAEDRSVLYVHALYVPSPEELRSTVHVLEDRLLRILR